MLIKLGIMYRIKGAWLVLQNLGKFNLIFERKFMNAIYNRFKIRADGLLFIVYLFIFLTMTSFS